MFVYGYLLKQAPNNSLTILVKRQWGNLGKGITVFCNLYLLVPFSFHQPVGKSA